MTDGITLNLDGKEIPAKPGQTIIEAAADAAGIYIPRLCHKPGLEPFGSCRVCTVKANGRPVTACTQPVSPGMVVENDTAELREHRKQLLEEAKAMNYVYSDQKLAPATTVYPEEFEPDTIVGILDEPFSPKIKVSFPEHRHPLMQEVLLAVDKRRG